MNEPEQRTESREGKKAGGKKKKRKEESDEERERGGCSNIVHVCMYVCAYVHTAAGQDWTGQGFVKRTVGESLMGGGKGDENENENEDEKRKTKNEKQKTKKRKRKSRRQKKGGGTPFLKTNKQINKQTSK